MTSVPKPVTFGNEIAEDVARLMTDFGEQLMNVTLEVQRTVANGMFAAGAATVAHVEREMKLTTDLLMNVAAARTVPDCAAAWEEFGRQQIGAWRQGHQQILLHSQKLITDAADAIPAPSSAGTD